MQSLRGRTSGSTGSDHAVPTCLVHNCVHIQTRADRLGPEGLEQPYDLVWCELNLCIAFFGHGFLLVIIVRQLTEPELRASEQSQVQATLRRWRYLLLANAAQEMDQVEKFDFVIINEVFERALFDLKTIVHAQRLKVAAQRRARADTFKSLRLA